MIQLDHDDVKVSCLSIPNNQVPIDFREDLKLLATPDYIDTVDGLDEDMYSMEEVKDVFESAGITTWEEEIEEIEKLMKKYECGYFRIIKVEREQPPKRKKKEEPHHV